MAGELLQDTGHMKRDVLYAVQLLAEPWILITSTTIKKCFVKCGFSSDRVGSNDDRVMKLTEDKEND
jgi:hypothetical protein